MDLKLHNYSALKISGQDATDFLQGQLTNDVTKLAGNWQFAGYCNPKGRLLALLMLWRHGEDYYALLNSQLAQATLKRLRMFVLRSNVVIEPLPANLTAKTAPAANYGNYSLLGSAHHLDFTERVMILDTADDDSASDGWSDTDWELANIKDGIPDIDAHTTELFVPQMINLDLLGGISFKKGCYTGQEIVARMHYLGKLKQRMYVCRTRNSSPNTAQASGGKISLASDPRVSVGHLASNFNAGYVLAVLRIEYGHDRLMTEAGDELMALESQPYAFPQKD